MSRCKACNVELHDVRTRAVEDELGHVHLVEEDLCPKCLTSAMSAVYGRDLTDDDLFDLEVLARYGTLAVEE